MADRLRQRLRRTHGLRSRGTARFSSDNLYHTLGLIRLALLARRLPWAKAGVLVREPDAGNPPVRFDEREVDTGHGALLGHRQTQGPATGKAPPKPPRHLSTLPGRDRRMVPANASECQGMQGPRGRLAAWPVGR